MKLTKIKGVGVGIGALTAALLLNPVNAFAASSFSDQVWKFAGTAGANIINFNKGASGIWDNGDLHVATDDFLWLDAGQRVSVNSSLFVNGGVLVVANTAQVGTLNAVGNVNVGGTMTAAGGTTWNGTLTANGLVTLGDGGDTVAVNSSAWDITAAGAGSGFTTFAATTFTGALTGNASTATALAANPADCGANTFATTIAASGALTCAAIAANNLPSVAADLGGANVTIDLGNTNVGGFNTNLTTDGTVTATTFIGALTGNASTATALAANPADCSANQFATTIAASGALTCAAIVDADVPDSITVTLAATATALAANPADCGANTFATTIAASGALTCAAIVDADVPNDLTLSTTGDSTFGDAGADTVTVNAETVHAVTSNVSFAAQTVSTTAATLTLTPTSSYVLLECNRAAAADTAVTLDETGARSGQLLIITISGANNAGTCSWADAAGVQQVGTTTAKDDFASKSFIYDNSATSQWVEFASAQ